MLKVAVIASCLGHAAAAMMFFGIMVGASPSSVNRCKTRKLTACPSEQSDAAGRGKPKLVG